MQAEFDALYTAHRDDIWRYLRRRAASEPEDLDDRGLPRGLAAPRRAAGARRCRGSTGWPARCSPTTAAATAAATALAERAGAHAEPSAPDLAEAVGLRTDLVRALAR